MYTEQQYELEKLEMPKHERMAQIRFEKVIDVLIAYKMQHPQKTIYLSEKCMGEAISWYMKQIKTDLNTNGDNI
uniref:Uncharacterized protein n=1 Tax=viral metagenome TaxID=1070528 RepID=A0A6C0L2Y4_9ZZZZ|tara:strand:+ start:4803 stop:5024 length:222 start_codon:yes stop_codon:yes gene_type:complete